MHDDSKYDSTASVPVAPRPVDSLLICSLGSSSILTGKNRMAILIVDLLPPFGLARTRSVPSDLSWIDQLVPGRAIEG